MKNSKKKKKQLNKMSKINIEIKKYVEDNL